MASAIWGDSVEFLRAVPAMPVSDIERGVEHYEERFGFRRGHVDDDFAIVSRDDVEVHLWAANKPGVTGAEPHLAGTASCRIEVRRIESFYEECRSRDSVHPAGHLAEQPWGTREFTAIDADNNAITFYEPV